jgi:exodeoxyribonuclease VII large subunit
VSWDLFTAAESARNEELARAVAAAQADAGFPGPATPAGRGGEEWTVSGVNAAAREMLEGVFPPLWVTGEVANFTRARSGHCYFTLRDERAQLRCVMWREEARRLPTAPAEGMQVRALGRLTLYEGRGEFQLVVADLDARGDGLWKLAFDRLRAKLDGEGLTAPERRRALPRAPACVGVVTSLAGAALRDVLAVVRRRAPWTRVVVAGCRVQGEGAAEEIAAAIRLFGRAGCADVLIVGRGGGSIEDLWAFNEEAVARAIAESPVPVISAVGHETDVTIADLVADLRAPTPSAAAEAAVPDGAGLRREAAALRERLASAAAAHVAGARDEVAEMGLRLAGAGERTVRARRDRLREAAGRLHALSPLGALARGFALPVGPEGKLLRGVGEFAPGSRFTLTVADGSVPCRVEESQAASAEG